MTLSFLEEVSFDAEKAGKKAAQLHLLAGAGFPVPPGFVLPTDVDPGSLSDSELDAAVERIGGYPVAVRSSGALEDLDSASFAGQYESYLDVDGRGELRAKIAECRASASNERVVTYLKERGLSPEDAKVGVLVQRMVPARLAGVGFSLHPVTGREEHALVELVAGLGDELVSGRVSPSRYVLALEDGTIVEEHVEAAAARLDPATARELARALLRVQAHFGRPQDVEWAIDAEGRLWVLQSRAITALRFRDDVEEFTNADFKDGGISARVCTPLMYSLYREAIERSMPGYFERIKLIPKGSGAAEKWIAMYYGRGYWNASAVKRALFKVPGFNEERFDLDLGIQKDYGREGPHETPTNAATVLPAIPIALALEAAYRDDIAESERFAQAFGERRREYEAKLAGLSEATDEAVFEGLIELVEEIHPWAEASYFTTIYNNSNAQSDFKSFLEKMDAATGRKSSVAALMAGLTDVHHMEVQRGIVALHRVATEHGFESAEWAQALEGFLEAHGFHGDAELDISVPRWRDDPERVKAMIARLLKTGGTPADPAAGIDKQHRIFEEELEAIRARLRSKLFHRLRFARGFEKHVARVRRYLSLRESMRELSTQTYALVRPFVAEAARRLVKRGALSEEGAVFMLSSEELVALVKGDIEGGALEEKIDFRRLMYDGYRDFPAPNELGKGVTQRKSAVATKNVDGKMVLQGLGCSPGIAEGVARVVRDLEKVDQIEPGDILVTRFTDPAWTPVLGLVSGVVTEVGGLLSHAAVIGREYGIPSVLDLAGATESIPSGRRVRIDGDSGVVEILE